MSGTCKSFHLALKDACYCRVQGDKDNARQGKRKRIKSTQARDDGCSDAEVCSERGPSRRDPYSGQPMSQSNEIYLMQILCPFFPMIGFMVVVAAVFQLDTLMT